MLFPSLGGFTPSERVAGPQYIAGGGLEAGLGILEKIKISWSCRGSIAGGGGGLEGTNGEDKKL